MKIFGLIAVIITGSLLIYAAADFPAWGDPRSPASQHLSPHYIKNALKEGGAPNMVTVVLADYRGFDTLFETAVIFTAGIAIIAILRRRRREEQEDIVVQEQDMIIQTGCRLLIPMIQIFALYVIAHGHHSPGGGFQGGVILGASLILMALAYDLKTALKKFSEKVIMLFANLGVLIYAGIGTLCLILGRNFLDYGILAKILFVDEVHARVLGTLGIEIGVGITVMSVMLGIYAVISSKGEMEEGI